MGVRFFNTNQVRTRFAIPLVGVAGLAALLGAFATGCSGAGDASSDASNASTSADSQFDGTYVASGAGPIEAIRFDADGYGLIPTGCSEASCMELGTYTIDESGTSMTLTNIKTNSTQTLPVQVTATQAAETASTQSIALRTDSLVTGATSPIVNNSGQPIVMNSSQPLVNTVSGALVNGQKLALVVNGVKLLSDCGVNIPTGYGDPTGAKAKAYWAMCPQGPMTPDPKG